MGPVEIEVVDAAGQRYLHKTTGSADKEIIRGASIDRPTAYNLDPDGAIPMWNSSHPAIQRNYILALYEAGHIRIAKSLAISYSEEHPEDDIVRKLLR